MREEAEAVEEMVAAGEASTEPPDTMEGSRAIQPPLEARPEALAKPPETASAAEEAPPASKKKKHPPAPKEQCEICLRWYNPTVVKRGHKCVPPVRAQPADPPDQLPAERVEEEVTASPRPPAAPPPVVEGQFPPVVAELPSWESVARWASHERESRRERKRSRWEQQMFG